MGSFDRLGESLASIHLNSQNVEEMDVEQVVDIPDTPDRRHGSLIHLDEGGSSAHDCVRKFEFRSKGSLDRFRSTGTVGVERCPNRRKYVLPREDCVEVDEFKAHNGIDASVSFERNAPSGRPALFRRTTNKLKSVPGSSAIVEHKDKGKSICMEASDKLPVYAGDGDKPFICEEKLFEMAFRSRALKSSLVGGTKDDRKVSSAGVCGASKGKANADSRNYNFHISQGNGGKGMDLGAGQILNVGGETPDANMSNISPKVNRNKRLVRNGCISPSNIALGSQRSVGTHEMCFGGAERGTSTHMVSVSDVVAGNIKGNVAKGKGVTILSPEPKSHIPRRNHSLLPDSSSRGTNVMVGGWRTVGGHGKEVQQSVSVKDGDFQRKHDTEIFSNKNIEGSVSKVDGGSGTITRDPFDTGNTNCSQSDYDPPYGDIPMHERSLLHIKRNMTNAKRKRGQCAINQARSRASALYGDSDILYLGSSKGSSSSGSSRIHNNGRMSILRPISEVDEHSIEIRSTHLEGVALFDNVDSYSIARQMEEDERLARQMEEDERLAHELQEQLYNEVPESSGFEIEDLAWALQEEGNAFPAASSPTQPFVRRRTFSTGRRHQLPTIRNPPTRRASQIVGPSRSLQSRSHLNRSTTASPRNRNHLTGSLSGIGDIQFPSSMDLEMRLDILEALEATVGDSNNRSRASNGLRTAASRILQVNREFNENDYEMLSTLDECNLLNLGLTARQISNLPESTIQADNFDDTCAICLETPTKGETIKHLPCLHKFHKDCIDVWLNRKKLCPICKSSIC